MLVEIIPNLWLTDYKTFKNPDLLNNIDINLIINCSTNIPFKKHMKKENIKLIRYEIDDNSIIDYNKTFKINKLIFKYLSQNKGVICYCYEGKQCSPCLISTYLIQYSKLEVNQITKSLQSKCPIIYEDKNNFELSLGKYKYNISNKSK